MKKVMVSTYCVWTSYGSILQTTGLQKALEQLGADSSVIVYNSDHERKAVRYTKSLAGVIQSPFLFLNKKRLEEAKGKGLQFIRENLRTLEISEGEITAVTAPDADIYIAGSDQIWHPAVCRSNFFLAYAPAGKKKISYAASMGVLKVPDKNAVRFAELLSNIDVISVREAQMVPVIEQYTDKAVNVHIDPTFLQTVEQWRAYEKPYSIKGRFILVYAIYWDSAYNEQLRRLHRETGYTIVSIQSSLRRIYSNRVLCDVGPAEFLWLVDHAEAVITSSFHGTAFSTIFNKRFGVVNNPDAGSRIANLLNTLGITLPEIKDVCKDFCVDYQEVNARIQEERNRSMEYLRNEIYGE